MKLRLVFSKQEGEKPMEHLTQRQVLDFIDGNLDEATERRVHTHLGGCDRCGREVAFQRSVLQTARVLPTIPVSRHFTQSVMKRALRKSGETFGYKVLQNLGHVFAMIAVLAVIVYMISLPSTTTGSTQPSQTSELLQAWKSITAQVTGLLTQQSERFREGVASRTTGSRAEIAVMTLAVLLLLAALDRFVLRRLARIKH
jgi:anti-sigma factor RsiW